MPTRILLSALLVAALAACSSSSGLAPGLTARMDAPGAALDRQAALTILNQFRASRGAAPLAADAALNQTAQSLAARYAETGTRPPKPADISAMQVSAGYATLAETFSGWRGMSTDAAILADGAHRKAGLGVAYNGNSTYGVYWVLLLDDGTAITSSAQ